MAQRQLGSRLEQMQRRLPAPREIQQLRHQRREAKGVGGPLVLVPRLRVPDEDGLEQRRDVGAVAELVVTQSLDEGKRRVRQRSRKRSAPMGGGGGMPDMM